MAESDSTRPNFSFGTEAVEMEGFAQGRATYTVDEALTVLGWGPTQRRAIAYSSLVWAFSGIAAVWLPMLSRFSRCTFPEVESWQIMLIGMAFFVGRPITATFMGMMADRFGRKLTILMAALYSTYFLFLASWSPSLPWMVFLVFVIGCSIGSMASLSLSYTSELQPPAYRKATGTALQAATFFGGVVAILFALIAYKAGLSWRVGSALSSVVVLTMISLYKHVPKSPHYLVSQHKFAQAEEVLQDLADENGTNLPPGQLAQSKETFEQLHRDEGKKNSWSLLVHPPTMLVLTISLCVIQMLSSFVYQSFFFLASSLTTATNNEAESCPPYNTVDYVNMIWSLAAEVPGCLVAGLSVRWMRQRLLFLSLGSGLVVSFAMLLHRNLSQHQVMMFLFVSRVFGSAVVHASLAYLPKFFPSATRGKGVGLVHSAMNLGPIIVPYTAGILVVNNMFAGKLVFILASTIFTIGCVLLPDVTSKPLKVSVLLSRQD